MTIGNFIFVIRKRINIEPSQALFIMINGQLVIGSQSISILYEEHQDEDGFLYITYTTENTFG